MFKAIDYLQTQKHKGGKPPTTTKVKIVFDWSRKSSRKYVVRRPNPTFNASTKNLMGY